MKKFWKNSWTIAIVPVLLGFILSVLWDLIKGKQILSTIGVILISIWKAVVAFLTFDLKVWWILLGIVILFAILRIVIKVSDLKETIKPKWLQYTDDTIDGFRWKWIWEKTYGNEYEIYNLHPVCPTCSTPFVNSNTYQINIICPRCKFQPSSNLPHMDNIKVIIHDNVQRMIDQENAEKIELENKATEKRGK